MSEVGSRVSELKSLRYSCHERLQITCIPNREKRKTFWMLLLSGTNIDIKHLHITGFSPITQDKCADPLGGLERAPASRMILIG